MLFVLEADFATAAMISEVSGTVPAVTAPYTLSVKLSDFTV
jgi:hypothetical protein